MSKSLSVIINKLTMADLDMVSLLEQQNPGPWSKNQLLDELNQPLGWQWLAKDNNGNACGYILGRSVGDESEILRLAVAHEKRNQGIAQQLLNHAFSDLHEDGIINCHLEIRASNDIARRLYEKNGFKACGIRKNYYHDPIEDGMVMTKLLQTGGHPH